MRTSFLRSALVFALSLSSAGCITGMLADGQIHATRDASGAFDTLGDYELARSAASAGLVQFEGMHRLRPDNEDAMMMLLKGWTGYGYGFAQDDWEVAVLAGDDDKADYHQKRAKAAYDRAIFYGVELAGHRAEGFDSSRKNEKQLKGWLDSNFTAKEDAELLFWLGYAWIARVNLMKDDPAYVADLFVAVDLIEKSRALWPDLENYSATTTLAAYHARSNIAEMDQAKQMFEDVLAKTKRKGLLVQVNYGLRYACNKGDKPLYEKLMNEVLSADDPDPNLRLQNTLAKRRAKRALSKEAMSDCPWMAQGPATPAPPPAASPAAASAQ